QGKRVVPSLQGEEESPHPDVPQSAQPASGRSQRRPVGTERYCVNILTGAATEANEFLFSQVPNGHLGVSLSNGEEPTVQFRDSDLCPRPSAKVPTKGQRVDLRPPDAECGYRLFLQKGPESDPAVFMTGGQQPLFLTFSWRES